ncbi:MAG: helix-turn-helix domain-containing protein [Clostridium sp.]|uniref:helix-turn-helix domain-containing protein n=1 Tax=Clostridium sp. TaxID=1506 RepID=UPI0025BEE838|nr:helix-turn-helix transcriptional regulator [Clostridium sp.]MCE5222058.1 helix-turn-helix domain-containing protein [Clostridium sp.]
MSIGDNIKKIRKNNKLTQKEFANKIEVSEVSIRKYESGQRNPSLEVLTKIAQRFDVNLSELMPNTEYNQTLDEYMKSSFSAIDILREFLKCDAVQEDCNYNYDELMFAEDIDNIYIFIVEMLKMKMAEIKSGNK